ncbi:MAG: type VII toxin-antitoxin system MntA family adenylyltransferase antitoxin [Candidatus Bathycorpusculaceae bacterium]
MLLERLASRLKADPEILFAYVYGSFIKREFFRDLDVAVWLKNPSKAFSYVVDFSARLEIELGVPVDVQVLNEAPLSFKFHVFTEGKILFSGDEVFGAKLVDEVIRNYLDFKFELSHAKGF